MTSPNRYLIFLIIAVCAAMWACGGGGSASGGIGGSGIQARSVGSVTAIGSITVNGVRFQTGTAAVMDDQGLEIAEGDLARGMVVEVAGWIEAGGVTGTAEQVTLVTAVQGPVDQASSAVNIIVMGQPVAIDDQTVIDDTIVARGGVTALDSSNVVEVWGTVDPNGTIHAMRIEDKTGAAVPFKVRGFSGAAAQPTFTINGLIIDYGSAAQNDFGPAGPAAGTFVSVRGSTLAAGTLIADIVEDETRNVAERVNIQIEGFIVDVVGATFTVATGAGTFDFRTDASTEFEGGGAADLGIGLEVEVEGEFIAGILLADKVEIKDGIRLETSVDIGSRSVTDLTIRPADMSSLVLKLNQQTGIDDNRTGFPESPAPGQLLSSLDGSETLRVRARLSITLVPNATELVVTDIRVDEGAPQIVTLRGPLDLAPVQGGDLQILGVTVSSAATATFLAVDDTVISDTEFFNQVAAGTLVEVNGVMAADNTMDANQLAIED